MITIAVICKKKKDQQLIAHLLSFHKDFQIIQTGENGYDAFMLAKLQPNVFIMDMHMAETQATDLAPVIRRTAPAAALIVLCSGAEKLQVGRAVMAGISGYLLTETDMDNLPVLVRVVSSGGYYISAPIIRRIFSSFPELDKTLAPAEDFLAFQNERERISRALSPTERGIISLLCQGYSDEEIAAELNLVLGTVRNYLTTIKHKTGLQNRSHIVIYAFIFGLINCSQIDVLKKTIDRLALIPYNGVV
jgi:DNA-binding NarL/FixJ family response regulator